MLVAKTKVVIVEDDKVIAILLKELLVSYGYQVLDVFVSGEDVINYLKQQKVMPDVVLMDIRLDGVLDGVQTALTLIDENIEVPIIYVTSNTDNEYIQRAKATRPIAFVKKPFDSEQLIAALELSMHGASESKKELSNLLKNNELHEMQIDELLQTQQHLVTATWRERTLKEELQKSKLIIEEQNKKILDSINYAKRIQKAIIPRDQELEKALGDYFMFYNPKDVVSGDFPWLYEKDGYIYIAVVDCTGHGVPGAMMSLVSFLLLNAIAGNDHLQTPGEILNALHFNVVKTLRQDESWNKAADGMDVAMCRIKVKTGEIFYSGAHRPLYRLTKGEIIQYKGDKYPIGGTQYKGENKFSDINFVANPGDSVYFFSDGLPDQFGGKRKMKFGSKRVRDLILEHGNKSMKEQQKIFSNTFNDWAKGEKQIDDVLLIAKRF